MYGDEYRRTHKLPLRYSRTLRHIVRCRTAALGGHIDRCNGCGHERISYNSCRNRHCPKCGALAKQRWLQARQEELLPVPYFHIVFTIPDELNALTLINQKLLYRVLFQSVSETLLCLARDPRHLGAEIGVIAVLHTWGQNLMDHPHVHCIVTGGGLSPDRTRWIGSRENFFIPVHVISQVYRGKFLETLKKCYRAGKLKCVGKVESLQRKPEFQKLLDRLYGKGWVVYAKQPFGGPKQVLDYLGRYTHRVAISNNRLVSISGGKVAFRWRDYRDGDKEKILTLDASEFIRRFLLHVLPDGLCKIRYYGFLSNRKRKHSLALCRTLLGLGVPTETAPSHTWEDVLLKLTGIDVRQCPVCHSGMMQPYKTLKPIRNVPP